MFTLKIDNCTYKVSFHHVMKTDLMNKLKHTVCSIQLVTEVADQKPIYHTLSTGVSYCSEKDNFNYNKGRKVALARALQYYNDKDYRKLFWDAYFKKQAFDQQVSITHQIIKELEQED